MRRVGYPQRRPPHRSLLHEPLSRPGPRRLTFCAVPGVLAMEQKSRLQKTLQETIRKQEIA